LYLIELFSMSVNGNRFNLRNAVFF
jgi:hypothetical protein